MPRLWSLNDGTPMVPNVTGVSWWSEFLPPWQTRIVDRPVDTLRTAELPRFEHRVRTNAGVPLQFTIPRMSTVISGGRLHRVGLPERVWVEMRTTDDNWFGIDMVNGMYYEASKLGPVALIKWFANTLLWNAYAFRAYDLKTRWDAQPPSLTGGGLPMWPMVPKIEHLNVGAGGVQHALHFVVSGGYSSEPFVAPARKSDGLRTDHPLRAGARLRLVHEAFERLLDEVQGPHDAALVWALRVYGAIVNDRSADVGHAIRMPLDPRLKVTVPLKLTDFEVVV